MLAGLALGLVGAVGAGRALESQLFGVPALDPLTLLATTVGFALAGYLAIWWPARRAASHRSGRGAQGRDVDAGTSRDLGDVPALDGRTRTPCSKSTTWSRVQWRLPPNSPSNIEAQRLHSLILYGFHAL